MFFQYLLILLVIIVPAYGQSPSDGVSYRLPNNTRPIHYDVLLETNVHKGDFEVNGVVNILIENRENSADITLHYRNLTVRTVRLWTATDPPLPVPLAFSAYSYSSITEFLKIYPLDNLTAGENYIIEIPYRTVLRTDNAGFYRTSYKGSDGKEIWLATTQFSSTDARHGFPCYDEPALKATFSISIKHDPSYTTISNMPAITPDPEKNPDGSVTTTFKTTPKFSTYLIAFLVSDFKTLEAIGSSGIIHRTIARSDLINQTNLPLEIGVKALDTLGSYLSINYTLPKLDEAAIPDFFGAMENWGLVLYREDRLSYDSSVTTYNLKTSIAMLIVHELSHQWFGNLVSPVWWSQVWLSEGFATIFEYIGVDLIYPDWQIWDYFVVNTQQNIFGADSLSTSHPMTDYIESPAEVGRIDSISYAKSGSVFRMFLHAFSASTFQKGLNYYLNDRAYREATEDHVFAAFEKAGKEDNTLASQHSAINIMSGWTRQAGYPVVNVVRDYENNTIQLSQERYLQSPTLVPDNTKWWIPVNYATAKNADFSDTFADYWLSTSDQVISFNQNGNPAFDNSDWVVFNKQATGYYRVKYDQENYDLITKALRENATVIHLSSRSQLLDDAAKFAQHDKQKWDIFLSLARYLVHEHEYVPWQSAINALSYLDSAYSGHKSYPLLTEYIRQLIEHLFEHVGVSDVINESHFRKYARTLAINWACRVGSVNCTTTANNAVKDLIRTGQEFHQNVRGQLYCAGLRTANETEYKAIWNRLVASTNVELRNTLFTALGCTRNATSIHSYLSSALPSTNSQNIQYLPGDAQKIVDAVYQSGPHGVRQTIEYLVENLFEASNVLPNLNGTIITMADRINSLDDFEQFRELANTATARNIITAFQNSTIHHNIADQLKWTEKFAPDITNWLLEHPQADGAASILISALTLIVAFAVSIIFN